MNNKIYSSRQEKLVAKVVGGKVVAGSGARDTHPGDVTHPKFLIECKTHTKQVPDVVFFADVWRKIAEEADSQFKCPALVVDDGTQRVRSTWVLTRKLAISHPEHVELLAYPDNLRDYSENTTNAIRIPLKTFSIVSELMHNIYDSPVAYSVKFCDEDLIIISLLDFSAGCLQ